MARAFRSGRFIPQRPDKYIGNAAKIIFRSSWELTLFKWLDASPAVIRWGSEELSIPYLNPLDSKIHRYFPDLIILYKDKTGNVRKEIVEIKPYKQTVRTPKMSEHDKMALVVNEAKWTAAADFAGRNGALFRVITEKSIFHQGKK